MADDEIIPPEPENTPPEAISTPDPERVRAVQERLRDETKAYQKRVAKRQMR